MITAPRVWIPLAPTVACALFACGCMTDFNRPGPTRQHVTACSVPSGAEVTINGRVVGYTPLLTTLDRGTDYVIRLSLDGYKSYEFNMIHKVDYSAWIIGNALYGGVVGLAIDATTGAYHTLSSSDTNVKTQRGSGRIIKVVLEKAR